MQNTLLIKLLGQFIELHHTQFCQRPETLTLRLYFSLFSRPWKVFTWKKNLGSRDSGQISISQDGHIVYIYKAKSIIHIYWRHKDNSIRQSSSSPQWLCSDIPGRWAHWLVLMLSLYMYYALCFVHVEHSVCHEPISILINIFTLLA